MNSIRIHYLQHVSYEGLGCIEEWAIKNNHQLTFTRFYESDETPDLESFDWLIIMGGPMSIHDEEDYKWLKKEKEFIKKAIDNGKIVIGICLGSQFIANALEGKVYKNKEKEIGWFDISLTDDGLKNWLIKDFEPAMKVFHWHGETFSLPKEAVHLMKSKASSNQAFLIKDKILGLQFHFEVTKKSLTEMIENGKDELIEDSYIQKEVTILNLAEELIPNNNQRMFMILDRLHNKHVTGI